MPVQQVFAISAQTDGTIAWPKRVYPAQYAYLGSTPPGQTFREPVQNQQLLEDLQRQLLFSELDLLDRHTGSIQPFHIPSLLLIANK
jgi:hypothetical protein